MKNLTLISQILIASLSSCGVSRVYTSGSVSSVHTYVPKPEYHGAKDKAFTLSGDISTGDNAHFAEIPEDKRLIVSFNANKSFTQKYFSFYYGGGASMGYYKFESDLANSIKRGERETFYTLQAQTGINFALSTKYIDFRLLGINFKYIYEFGPYQNRLKEIQETFSVDDEIIVVREQSLFVFYLNTEFAIKINKNNCMLLELYGGRFNFDRDKYPKSEFFDSNHFFWGYSVNYRFKKFTLSFVSEEATELPIRSKKFGLAYKLF